MTTERSEEDPSGKELRLTRELAAPRPRVWAALTDPAHLARWWGPSGFTTETHTHDLRVGGSWRLTMRGPDGRAYLNHAVFDQIDAPSRLVLRYVDAAGAEPALHTTTITLTDVDPGRTRLTLSLRFPTAAARADAVDRYGAVEGGHQTLARLAALLEARQGAAPSEDFVVRRVLAASPARVWAVWTDAAHLNRWFHPEVWTITSSELDLRVGGTFFYTMAGPDIPPMRAMWRFTEVDAPRRLAFELSFVDADRAVTNAPFGGPWPRRTATTLTLEPHAGIGGGTLLTLTSTPIDAPADAIAAFRQAFGSMETGWGQTLDALVAHLAAPDAG